MTLSRTEAGVGEGGGVRLLDLGLRVEAHQRRDREHRGPGLRCSVPRVRGVERREEGLGVEVVCVVAGAGQRGLQQRGQRAEDGVTWTALIGKPSPSFRYRPMSVPGSRVSSTASSVESVLLISNWKELESVGKVNN